MSGGLPGQEGAGQQEGSAGVVGKLVEVECALAKG